MKAEVLTYSRARGLFAGIDLSGAAITQDKDETRVLYGHMVPFSDILNGKFIRPQRASLSSQRSPNTQPRLMIAT